MQRETEAAGGRAGSLPDRASPVAAHAGDAAEKAGEAFERGRAVPLFDGRDLGNAHRLYTERPSEDDAGDGLLRTVAKALAR